MSRNSSEGVWAASLRMMTYLNKSKGPFMFTKAHWAARLCLQAGKIDVQHAAWHTSLVQKMYSSVKAAAWELGCRSPWMHAWLHPTWYPRIHHHHAPGLLEGRP